MTRVAVLLVGLLLMALPSAAGTMPPDDRLALLRRGVNITGWFRYPVSGDPARLAAYIDDRGIAGLRAAGFTFVRLPVDPALLVQSAMRASLGAAVHRLRAAGLGVVVSLHPTAWRLEEREQDRAALVQAWRQLAPLLRTAGAAAVFPEIVNEPVFPADAPAWAALRRRLLATLRTELPAHTVILPGNDWSSIAGLVATGPDPDPNAVYTFHFYEPADLTALAPWRGDIDRARLARLPFPVVDGEACGAAGRGADRSTASAVDAYCAAGWNRATIADRIAAAAAWGRRHSVPLLLGEFGASVALNAQARTNWLQTVRSAAEANGIGWALWGHDDIMGFALPRPIPARPVLDPGVLRALGL